MSCIFKGCPRLCFLGTGIQGVYHHTRPEININSEHHPFFFLPLVFWFFMVPCLWSCPLWKQASTSLSDIYMRNSRLWERSKQPNCSSLPLLHSHLQLCNREPASVTSPSLPHFQWLMQIFSSSSHPHLSEYLNPHLQQAFPGNLPAKSAKEASRPAKQQVSFTSSVSLHSSKSSLMSHSQLYCRLPCVASPHSLHPFPED